MFLRLLEDENPKNQQKDPSEMTVCLADEVLMILSSRPREHDIRDYPELSQSVINYGVSDVFPADMSRGDRNRVLKQRILEALQLFEPRLKNISVSAENESMGCCSFIIEADTVWGGVIYHLEWDDLLSHFSLRS